MLPTVVLVGRPNVGKSTLFNCLTRSRNALVADFPGLTRDRHYGKGQVGPKPYWVVDTGGFTDTPSTAKAPGVVIAQTLQAMTEADVILLITDAREGLSHADRELAHLLRQSGRTVRLVVNKAEGREAALVGAEFHELALGIPLVISAAHGQGIAAMIEEISQNFPSPEEDLPMQKEVPHLAIVGRPNVGKSTLVNALLGENRMVVEDQPGTTRDAIQTPLRFSGRDYVIVDTAGLRRKAKVAPGVEKLSALKTLEAIERSQVVVVVMDANQEVGEQDLQMVHLALEAGRALVVAMNKWDLLSPDLRSERKEDLLRRLRFFPFVVPVFIAANRAQGLAPLMREVTIAYDSAVARLPTPKLTRALREAVVQQAPPRQGLVRPKLRYAHQGGMKPPTVVIHGSALDKLPQSYIRYLIGVFCRVFQLRGTPLKLEMRNSVNPYQPTVARRKR